jgi:hypothetical protein
MGKVFLLCAYLATSAIRGQTCEKNKIAVS